MFKDELSQLLFPSRCLSCSALGPSICSQCRSTWNPHIYRQTIDGLVIYSSIRYTHTAQKIVLGAKESGLKVCDELVIGALKASLQYFMRERGDGLLVPIPSRASARRKRARDFILDLTTQLDCPAQQLLEIKRFVRDQSRLTHEQRAKNLAGAFHAHAITQGEVILIDDVVTSGSTLLEAKKALARRGIVVKGAITAVMA